MKEFSQKQALEEKRKRSDPTAKTTQQEKGFTTLSAL